MTCFHHTKTKGDLGVMKAKLDLMIKGYMILQPETEHAPFDIVVYKDGRFLRVQVKYIEMNEFGSLRVRFTHRWMNSKGGQTRPIDKNAIDLFCVYCPDTDTCYYVDPKKFGQSMKIRIKKSKFKTTPREHPASDFLNIVIQDS